MGILFARAGDPLRRVLPGGAVAAAGAADPVRGLRGLAAAMAVRRACSTRQLAYWRRQLAGVPGAPRAADRPSAAGGRSPPRRDRALRAAGRAGARRSRALARRRGRDALHDPARRLHGAPRPLRGAGRRRRRHRRSPNRTRREIEGLIGFFVNTLVLRTISSGDAGLRAARRPGARDRARRLRAPGPAVRAAGRGAAAGAEPEPQPAVPGDVRATRTSRAPKRRCAASTLSPPEEGKVAGGTAKFDLVPLPLRRRRPSHRSARIQHASFSTAAIDAAPAALFRASPRGSRRRPGSAGRRPAAARRGGAAPALHDGTTPPRPGPPRRASSELFAGARAPRTRTPPR